MRTLEGGPNVANAFFCSLWLWPIEKSKTIAANEKHILDPTNDDCTS
jgi:hypothetical protein